jgi:cation:H+ antiporter
MATLQHAVVFLTCLLILVKVADHVVDAVLAIARRYEIPSAVAGATLAAAATSAPELATNTFALLSARGDGGGVSASIGAAAIIGSAVFNLAVIVGFVGLTAPATLQQRDVLRDTVSYTVAVIAALVFLLVGTEDNAFSRWEGAALVAIYGGYAIWLVRDHRAGRPTDLEDSSVSGRPWLALLLSIATIAVACHFLVESTRHLALVASFYLGLDPAASAAFIAIVVVAAATSAPDLLTSVAAARRGHVALAIGNAIGSNTFDILVGVGAPAAALGGERMSNLVVLSGGFLLATSLLLLLLLTRAWRVTEASGALLIGAYVAFVALAGSYLAFT